MCTNDRPVLFLLCSLVTLNTWANSVPSGYQQVAKQYQVPADILFAIALTESGKSYQQQGKRGRVLPWPWTLNVAGDSRYYPTRHAAWQTLKALLASGKTNIDIGLMQVNWRWHNRKLGNPWQALDPYFNLRVGARILRQQFNHSRDWWLAVGRYHKPGDPQRAARYRSWVKKRWLKLNSASRTVLGNNL